MMVMNTHSNFLNDINTKKYNSDNVICVTGTAWGDLRKVKEELLKSPLIEGVTWCSNLPEMGGTFTKDWKSKDNKTLAQVIYLEEDYPTVFKIDMTRGRFYSNKFQSDKEYSIVINQLMADAMEYPDPIGQPFIYKEKSYKVVGVIDTYRSLPPILDNMPLIVRPADSTAFQLAIRINGHNKDDAKAYIKTTLTKFNPDYPLDLTYHTDVLYGNRTAKTFISAMKLTKTFYYLTIITSLVGLFGLSLFIAQRNRREVGIRRVLGASTQSLMLRLSKGIIIQVFIAILLATPVSMIATRGYLSVFPGNFKIGLPVFLLGGGIALVLVLLTIGWQTYLAAKANPTEALRSE